MKLNYFSSQTLPRSYTKTGATIAKCRFSKNGVISLNRPAIELMALKAGDKITLAQDDENPEDWYLFLDKEHGFELKGKDFEKKGILTFSHTGLKNTICECFGLDNNVTHTFYVAGRVTMIPGSKTKYWGLLQSPAQ